MSKDGNKFVGSRYDVKFNSTGSTVSNWRNCTIELDKNETSILRQVFDLAFDAQYAANDAEHDCRASAARLSQASYNEAVKNGEIKHREFNDAAYNKLQNEE